MICGRREDIHSSSPPVHERERTTYGVDGGGRYKGATSAAEGERVLRRKVVATRRLLPNARVTTIAEAVSWRARQL